MQLYISNCAWICQDTVCSQKSVISTFFIKLFNDKNIELY